MWRQLIGYRRGAADRCVGWRDRRLPLSALFVGLALVEGSQRIGKACRRSLSASALGLFFIAVQG